MIAAAPCLSAVSKIKNTYLKNGLLAIHFGRGESNQPSGHPNGYPLIRLSGNPYNQPIYFKAVIKRQARLMLVFRAAMSFYEASIPDFVSAVPSSFLDQQIAYREH